MNSLISLTLVLLSALTATPIKSSNLGSPQGVFDIATPIIQKVTSKSNPLSNPSLSNLDTNDVNPLNKVLGTAFLAAMRKSKRAVHLDQPATGAGIAGAAARESTTIAASGKPGPMVRFKQGGDDAKMRRDWNDGHWYSNDFYNGY
jgi:hypothetical protein